jgi:hypothetical protein
VTLRALSGLAALNLSYALVGLALLWSFGALRTWNAVARLVGLGYLVGLAAFGVLWTTLLVVGVPFDGMAIVVSLVALAVAGAALARYRGMTVHHGPRRAPATWTVLVAAAGIALTGVFLESLFRSARIQSLQAYDAWAFWVPKGKAIYFFHGLDEHVFTTTPNSMYPPLQPIVDATAFHAIGGPDAATLHVQFWFLIVGAVAAVVGLLHRHVPVWLLWPPVLLVLVVPRFSVLMLAPLADVLVDLLVVVAALLVALWIRDTAGWRLAAAGVLLAGAVNTKREGIVFAACILVAAFVASRPRSWPPLALTSLAVGLAVVPWRIWTERHDISSGAPSSFETDRLAGALRLSSDVLYSNARWSVLPVVATIALGAAAVWGDRRLAAYVGVLGLLLFAGGVWSTVGFPELAISADESGNPIVRYTGSLIFLAAVATPLLLASVWRGGEEP